MSLATCPSLHVPSLHVPRTRKHLKLKGIESVKKTGRKIEASRTDWKTDRNDCNRLKADRRD